MKNKKDYGMNRKEKSEIFLRIPEGPGPKPEGGFFEVRGGAGHQSYQHYAQHCLNEHGGEHSLESFAAKFTAWSLEDAGGVVLYPDGPAFKVLQRHFTEGEEPVIFYAEAAYYSALMLCLHPTVFPPGASGDEPLASYAVYQSLEPGDGGPGGYTDHPVVAQKTIATTGEIFMIKFNYYPHKVSYKIRIFPSLAGRNNILLGGRLGTIPSESI